MNQLLDSLFDIAKLIQIEPFCIYHPHYQEFALPTQVAERFKQTSIELQLKYLNLLLRNFLHGIYYNGSLQTILAINTDKSSAVNQNLENNSLLEIDWQFYELLDANNHGIGYFDPDWQVLRKEPDGSIAVTKGGLILYVEQVDAQHVANRHLEPINQCAIGEFVAIWMPKNRLKNGFYIALSNFGQEKSYPDADLGVGRIFFNLTPEGAIALMNSLTLQLNAAAIGFSFQVPYNRCVYNRYDSGILYFERKDYPVVREILQIIYAENQDYFHTEVPLFTKFLAPGLGLAEEPQNPNSNFGLNRCQIVASALLSAWQKGKNSPDERMIAIHQHFAKFGIDLQRPYLNPYSEDIYFPI
ncbi:T3SS effector HopA1 family protein [Iningainema tapete]|uniref:Uncharacterized protein n=1 Tax=Iningainema tapete BLCC-T55 TaxID=2748662 RepID=A0A8J7CFE2_9CYAN|nr:T3SS effector HopA1 family protein [Iningainema tapete]MBD2774750.1 hypothetical protein [Iningainema tapete BLCC-T55]